MLLTTQNSELAQQKQPEMIVNILGVVHK